MQSVYVPITMASMQYASREHRPIVRVVAISPLEFVGCSFCCPLFRFSLLRCNPPRFSQLINMQRCLLLTNVELFPPAQPMQWAASLTVREVPPAFGIHLVTTQNNSARASYCSNVQHFPPPAHSSNTCFHLSYAALRSAVHAARHSRIPAM